MATNPPCYPCIICGGKLEWRDVTRPRLPGEPIRFGPNDWQPLPHTCPSGAVEKFYEEAFRRGAEEKAKPFFTKTIGMREI